MLSDYTQLVFKFGGSVLDGHLGLSKAASLASKAVSNKHQVACVASALSGATDALIACANLAKGGEVDGANDLLEVLWVRHMELAASLDGEPKKKTRMLLEEVFSQTRKDLVHATKEGFEDKIGCCGEKASAILLAGFLEANGMKSRYLDSFAAGIVAVGDYSGANADIESTRANFSKTVWPLIESGVVPVITGYYGIRSDGKEATFGRGGTDYSTALVCACLNGPVERRAVVLWKNVDGFMTADPRIIPQARVVPELAYSEAGELGFFGAKILHPRTMDPIEKMGIPVFIKKLDSPWEHEGTKVTLSGLGHGVKAIACKSSVAVVTVCGTLAAQSPGMAAQVFSNLEKEKVNVDVIVTSEASISCSIPRNQVARAKEAMKKVNGSDNWSIQEDVSILAVIGEGLQKDFAPVAKTLSALSSGGISIQLACFGPSGCNFSLIVKERQFENAVGIVHRTLFESIGGNST